MASIQSVSTDGDLAGHIQGPGWVIKYDSLFNTEWEKSYNSDTCGFSIQKIRGLKNGEYIFGGGGGGCTGDHGDGDFALIKIYQDGNILWYKLYGSPGGDGLDSFLPTQDGGYLVTGTSKSSGGDIPFHYEGGWATTDAIIFKTDSVGNLLWLKNLGGSGYDGFLGDPVEISRGQYVLSISSNSEDYDLAGSGISGVKRWIFQMDSLGNISNENFISPYDLDNGDRQTGFIKQKVALVGRGNANSLLFPAPSGHLAEEGAIGFIDTATLQLVDMIQWGGSGYGRLVKYTQDEFGNYYFLGFSNSTDYDLPGNYNNGDASDYWLMATDSNFNLLWSRNFGGSDECGDLGCSQFDGNIVYKNNMLYAFIKNVVPAVLPDYDIECGHPSVLGGFGITDAWIVAFDLSTAIPQTPDASKTFLIYPNPADKQIIIEPSILENKEIKIIITDINGKEIYSENHFQNENIKINTQKFSSGMYVIAIVNEYTNFQTKIIIQ